MSLAGFEPMTLPLVILMRHTFTKSLITQVPPKCVNYRQSEIEAKGP